MDVYSFGACMLELLLQVRPYPGLDRFSQVTDAFMGALHFQKDPADWQDRIYATLGVPLDTGDIGDNTVRLVRDCMQWDPAKRPTFATIVERLKKLVAPEAPRLDYAFKLRLAIGRLDSPWDTHCKDLIAYSSKAPGVRMFWPGDFPSRVNLLQSHVRKAAIVDMLIKIDDHNMSF
jgi:serine/threonine protein kinase